MIVEEEEEPLPVRKPVKVSSHMQVNTDPEQSTSRHAILEELRRTYDGSDVHFDIGVVRPAELPELLPAAELSDDDGSDVNVDIGAIRPAVAKAIAKKKKKREQLKKEKQLKSNNKNKNNNVSVNITQSVSKTKGRRKATKQTYVEVEDDPEDETDDEQIVDSDGNEDERVPESIMKVKLFPTKKRKTRKKQQKTNKPNKKTPKDGGRPDEDEEEEYNVLDYEEDSHDEEDDDANNDKKDVPLKWALKGWTIDPRKKTGVQPYGPRLSRWHQSEVRNILDYLLLFLPVDFFKRETIPATNRTGRCLYGTNFQEVDFDEFMHFLALVYAMEVYSLPERKLYWMTEDDGLFKALNFGRFMTRNRFDEFVRVLAFSLALDTDTQITDLIDAINETLTDAVTAGDVICVDESMIKSYHKELKGKLKIKRKPRPIGNECKKLCAMDNRKSSSSLNCTKENTSCKRRNLFESSVLQQQLRYVSPNRGKTQDVL